MDTHSEMFEQALRGRLDAMTRPTGRECVLCYVARMLEALGCDGTLHWAGRFRDVRAPEATGLESRMTRVGGFCDCEILMNGWELAQRHLVWNAESGDLEEPEHAPTCSGVSSTSTRPCSNWVRIGRR